MGSALPTHGASNPMKIQGTEPMSTVSDAIRGRHSVRAFLPNEVPEVALREVFELAQWAPSNCNVQPWFPHVVSGPRCEALRHKLSAAGRLPENVKFDWPADGNHGDHEGNQKLRQHAAAAQLYGAMGVARHDLAARQAAMLRNYSFFDAPHAVFIFMARPFDWRGITDCGIYAQTLMLAMWEKGIASCAQGALAAHPHIVREHLGVPQEHRLLLGISFGYEDKAAIVNSVEVGREQLHHAVQFHR